MSHETAEGGAMILKPVVPFEPINTDKLPAGDHWVAQVKWDGVRMLSYFDGSNVQLVNRKLNNRSLQYPEFFVSLPVLYGFFVYIGRRIHRI